MPNKTFHGSLLKQGFNSLCIPWEKTDWQSQAKKVTSGFGIFTPRHYSQFTGDGKCFHLVQPSLKMQLHLEKSNKYPCYYRHCSVLSGVGCRVAFD